MPAFYTLPSARNMPLTPPEYHGGGAKPVWSYHDPANRGPQMIPGHHDYQGSYFGHGTVQEQPQPPSEYSHHRQDPPPRSRGDYPATQTQLPPLQYPAGQTRYPTVRATQLVQSKPKVPEEKVTGGVSATLDYPMERMVDFVAETVQGMYALYDSKICLADIDIVRSVSSGSTASSSLRAYVSQIFSSTRLPSATIQLALHYLSVRLVNLSTQGKFESYSDQSFVQYLLTIALLLGSKFFDDNTFQNRSWAEVSSIPVGTINKGELEWLLAIDWQLHSRHDEPDGWQRFEALWHEWSLRKDAELQLESFKLTPLEPSLPQQGVSRAHFPGAALYSHDQFPPVWDAPFCEDPLRRYGRPYYEASPPSAPHTGPNTPEWYNGYYGPRQPFALQPWQSARYFTSHDSATPITDGTFHFVREQDAAVRAMFKDRHRCECGLCSPQRASVIQGTTHDHRAIVGAA